MSRFTNDIDTVSEMINNSFANVLSNSLTFLCTIGMLLYLNWALTLSPSPFWADAAGGEGHRWTQPGQLPAAAGRSGRLNGYIER